MRRALLLVVLGAAACRPASHGEPVRVVVPVEVAREPRYAFPLDVILAVPPNVAPRTLRPDPETRVEIPAEVKRPRRMEIEP